MADIHAQVTGKGDQLAGGLEIKWESGWIGRVVGRLLSSQQPLQHNNQLGKSLTIDCNGPWLFGSAWLCEGVKIVTMQ